MNENNVIDHPSARGRLEQMVTTLSRHPDYRVLQKVPEPFAIIADEIPENGRVIAILDTETTGLDPQTDTIIELAILLAVVDRHGEIVGHLKPESWLQDPGQSLDPNIKMVTGLKDEDLFGQKINVDEATKMLQRADLILAHNAAFDAAFVERLLPQIKGKKWACSCAEIDWLALGFDGRSQGYLLTQTGWFSSAHRAASDVWSLLWLLQQRDIGANTLMKRLINAADRDTARIEATNAGFSRKDALRKRGYRWDAIRSVWWKNIDYEVLAEERDWLNTIGVASPKCRNETASERHRSPS